MFELLGNIVSWFCLLVLLLIIIYGMGRLFGLGFRKSLLEARKKEVVQKNETIGTKKTNEGGNGKKTPRIIQ